MPTPPTIDALINIADPGRQGLLGSFASQGQGLMDMLVRSDGEELQLSLVQPSNSSVTGRFWDYVDPSAATVEVAIGEFNQLSTAGQFYLMPAAVMTSGSLIVGKTYVIWQYNAGDSFTNAGAASNGSLIVFTATSTTPTTWTNGSQVYEVTSWLAYNSTAAQVATALNATAAITAAGGVTVTLQSAGNYIVTWIETGAQAVIGGYGVQLAPASSIIGQELQVGGANAQEIQLIRLVVNPYCYATPSTPLPAAAATGVQTQVGSGDAVSIQTVTVNPDAYAGSWQLTIGASSYQVPYNATAASIQAQIGTGTIVVSSPINCPNVFIFTWVAPGAQTAITTSAANLLVPVGVTGPLITNTEGVLAAFARQGMPDTIQLYFQVRVTFPGQNPRTILLVQVTVSSTVIDIATMVPAPLPTYYTQAQCLALFCQFVTAPSGPNDFSMFPGSAAPTSGFYFALVLNALWAYRPGLGSWQTVIAAP